MQQHEREEQDTNAREAAYRHGWTQSFEEASRLVLQLIELGYKPTIIKRLLAVYDDHFLAVWRNDSDLSTREAPPAFDINKCQAILSQTTGYDWIV